MFKRMNLPETLEIRTDLNTQRSQIETTRVELTAVRRRRQGDPDWQATQDRIQVLSDSNAGVFLRYVSVRDVQHV